MLKARPSPSSESAPITHAFVSSLGLTTTTRRVVAALIAAVLVHVVLSLALTESIVRLSAPLRLLAEAAMVLAAIGLPVWLFVGRPGELDKQALLATHAKEMEIVVERQRIHDLNVRLTNALEIAEDEDAVLRIARQALAVAADGAPAQLLLADAPDAPMRHSLVEGDLPDAARCYIERPCDCPSVRRGMGMVYEDSLVLSACRGLKGPLTSSCAAACAPITVAGAGVGMVRALGETGDPVLYKLMQSLNTASHHVGARLATVRSMAASARQASTDPMTGAANRRSAEQRLTELVQRRESYTLAMLDIDHFKKINDRFGHDIGDRAIRLLVDTIRLVIRREDLLCRWGGEEFLLVLPGIDAAAAMAMLQRLRSELPGAAARAGLEPYTFSAGVADAPCIDSAAQIRAADAALYRAKADGRDRVQIADAAVAV